jgi:hypothetical protein
MGTVIGLQLTGGKTSFSTVFEWIRSIETKLISVKRESVSISSVSLASTAQSFIVRFSCLFQERSVSQYEELQAQFSALHARGEAEASSCQSKIVRYIVLGCRPQPVWLCFIVGGVCRIHSPSSFTKAIPNFKN